MSSNTDSEKDRPLYTYPLPTLTKEEYKEYKEDCRIKNLIYQVRRYLSSNEYSPNKWDPLLNSDTKPASLRIADSDWEEAQGIARILKRKEDEETYEDDFEDPSSSSTSSSSSSTSCQSSSSMEYGVLRVTSPFSAAAQPNQPSISFDVKQSKDSHIKFDQVHVKDFYVSKRERQMKSEACPPEMVRKNQEEVELEFMISQIKVDETADLDRLVFRKLKFKTVHQLERGWGREIEDESVDKTKEFKVPTYADFLEKSTCGPETSDDKTYDHGVTADGKTSEFAQDSKANIFDNSVKANEALRIVGNDTRAAVHAKEESDVTFPTSTIEDESNAVGQVNVSEEPENTDSAPRAESSASQNSNDSAPPEMTDEEIIARLEEKDINRIKVLHGKSYSADSFKAPAGPKHRDANLQARHACSAPLTRLCTVPGTATKCTRQPHVARTLTSGDVGHSAHSTSASSGRMDSPPIVSKPKHCIASADSGMELSTYLVSQPNKTECQRLDKNNHLNKISSACEITPRGGCRVIHVKPAPGTEFYDSNEDDIEEKTKEKYDRCTSSENRESSTENGTPYPLRNDIVETPTVQTRRSNTSRPRWRRRLAAVILRLRGFGDRLKSFNCSRCL